MNLAGPLASLLFALTVLTVFGGLFAYGVYKARERRRERPPGAAPRLEYFVEYVPEPVVVGAPADEERAPPRRAWRLYALSALALAGLSVVGVHYYRAARGLVVQGAWSAPSAPAAPSAPDAPPSEADASVAAP